MIFFKIIRLVVICTISLMAYENNTYFTKANTKNSFSQRYDNLNNTELDTFILGKSFFKIPWVQAPSATTARDGLGALFSANTCTSCHRNNSQGSVYSKSGLVSRTMVVRLSIPSNNSKEHKEMLYKNGFVNEPTYGAQLSINGTQNVPYEGRLNINYTNKYITYSDGQTVVLRKPTYALKDLNYGKLNKNTILSVRKSPALVGLGLLEDLSDKDILKNEDEFDINNDGISGKANFVYSIVKQKHTLGRYTYKASVPSVIQQSAAAFHNDMGLTTTYFPYENCTLLQKKCLNQVKAKDSIDVSDLRLEAIDFYLRNLKVPKVNKSSLKGKKIFEQLNCTACHISSFATKKDIIISPYSDFLLHDMGDGLSDGRSEFKATSQEWRTAPLWGINSYSKTLGAKADFLHDGRARNIEEAILWHGGEALKAQQKFISLSKQQRDELIKFIGSL